MTTPLTEPLAYMLISHSQSCTSCGTISHHSDLFVKRHLTPRCGYGKSIVHLTPVQEAILSLPIEIIQNTHKSLPFCTACIDPTQQGNPFWVAPGQPRPTRAPYAIVGLSYEDLGSAPEPKAKPSTTTTRTIADVLNLLNPTSK